MHLENPHQYHQSSGYFLLCEKFLYSVFAAKGLVEKFVSDPLSGMNTLLDALLVAVPLQQYFQMFQLHYLLVEYSKVWHLHGAVEIESAFGDYSLFMACP